MSRNLWSRWVPRLLSRPRSPRQRPLRPMLEQLESRLTPAVFSVGPADVTTLINDINTANSNGQSDTINLSPSVYTLTAVNNFWYGPTGLPAIDSNLIIHGNGATIAREMNPAAPVPFFRLFYVSGGMELPPGSLSMDNVTLEGGVAGGGDSGEGGGGLGAGGAIFNQGTLALTDVTLTNNEAFGGTSDTAGLGLGGGGMGGDAPTTGDGGFFGGTLGNFFGGIGGGGGAGGPVSGGGGGGGFLIGANGETATSNIGSPGSGGGLGGFGGGGIDDDGGAGGVGPSSGTGGSGGDFGFGGSGSASGGGGGGGIGGGGGSGSGGGSGGFGGGGGAGSSSLGGDGGFGGGGGITGNGVAGFGGFGGGNGTTGSGGGGAAMGGAIFNMGADSAHPRSGQVTLTNCTLTNNTADGGNGGVGAANGSGLGGALFNLDGAATLTNDTLAANIVIRGTGIGATGGGADGGAVYNLAFGNDIDTNKPVAASLVLNNSILATSSDGHDLASAAINRRGINTATVSGSHNLVMSSSGSIAPGVITLTANPDLGPLQNNGGPTPTMLPLPGSPVLGAGVPSLAPSTDQRGVSRPPNGPTDLGSVQVSVLSTPGGGGSGSGAPTSAGLLGLVIEEFELTVDTVLALVEGALHMPHASLDATIAQVHTAINSDPLTPTSEGQLAILLGEIAALNALSGS